MKTVVTARRLIPGHFDAFRQAWQPERFPEGMVKAYILRDPHDPDQVTAMGLFDVAPERLAALRVQEAPMERAREERIAPHVSQTLVAGFFDVVMSMEGCPATGCHGLVPMTERRLKPGASDEFLEALTAYTAGIRELPPDVASVAALANEANPEHMIQFGVVRTDDPEAFAQESRRGRATMLEALAPFIDSIGIDTTYDLVEEVTTVGV
jgi:hypothetical protein